MATAKCTVFAWSATGLFFILIYSKLVVIGQFLSICGESFVSNHFLRILAFAVFLLSEQMENDVAKIFGSS